MPRLSTLPQIQRNMLVTRAVELNDGSPQATLARPLAESTLALLTSAGPALAQRGGGGHAGGGFHAGGFYAGGGFRGGSRLRPATLAVTVGGKNIFEVTSLAIRDSAAFFAGLELSERDRIIAERVLKEVNERLTFLLDVGLDYLSLARSSGTLAGGEAQRIRLASQIGSGLVGVLYVLDEPSIGLHQRDNRRLIDTMIRLRNLGNTVIVV